MKIKFKNFTTKEDNNTPTKIIYWYDKNIKMYTFQVLNSEGEEIEPCYYTSKPYLKVTKESYIKSHGIKPIKQ